MRPNDQDYPKRPGWYFARWRGYGKPWHDDGEFKPTEVMEDYQNQLVVDNPSRGHGDPISWDLVHFEWGEEIVLPKKSKKVKDDE